MARDPQSLRCIRLFRRLSDEEIRHLDAQCLWRRYEAKQEIVGHGEAGTDVYFVASGMLRALIRTDGVRDVILGDIGCALGPGIQVDSRNAAGPEYQGAGLGTLITF